MGIERRRNNVYYYKKRREGSRVVSEYVGSGELVHLAEYEARKEREQKQREREALLAEQASMDEIDALVDSFCATADRIVEDSLLALGYHKHNRQWRRKPG